MIMTNSEIFALDQWLTDYPENMGYSEIIALMSAPNTWRLNDFTVWELVENCTTDQVAGFIEDTKRAFENML
tara:strand:+ start:1493 stop:1708 length:216 start_codon:yes stop_codon:yes gene_type:complete